MLVAIDGKHVSMIFAMESLYTKSQCGTQEGVARMRVREALLELLKAVRSPWNEAAGAHSCARM
jgi:hypothetical protein